MTAERRLIADLLKIVEPEKLIELLLYLEKTAIESAKLRERLDRFAEGVE